MKRHGWLTMIVVVALSGVLVGPVAADLVGSTELVSKSPANGPTDGSSRWPAISSNGTIITYTSDATNLVAGDTNARSDVFVYDTTTDTTTLISRAANGTPANGDSTDAAISGDGTTITYSSDATNLVADDTNAQTDVFVHDTTTNTTTLISRTPQGTPANDWSGNPAISGDGTTITYSSAGTDLVADDTNNTDDVFVFDTTTDTTTLISRTPTGTPANDWSGSPAISADGTTVTYASNATDLVADDTNAQRDVFAYDTTTDTTTLISRTPTGTPANGISGTYSPAAISDDGTTITYESAATDLVAGDTNAITDVFAYDTTTDTTTLISRTPEETPATASGSYSPAISGDGTTVTYSSDASGLSDPPIGHVFVYDITTDTTTLISRTPDGTPANYWSESPAISGDGTTITYSSYATDLVAGDTNAASDVFAWSVNQAPIAGPVTVTVSEDAPVGTVVGTVSATDPEFDVLSYTIAAGNDSGLFAIESTTGTLTTTGTLDYETTTQHVLTVGVSDGLHDVYVLVTINVNPNSFDDDDGSIFENDIEWLAAAGITKGCGTRRFCPTDNVTRGQMAAFLNRALNLPSTTTDFFTDDNGTLFENDINELAASGITKGCSTDSYCANDNVTRGQMAAFLRRALSK